jgi:acyl-CoA synthetase (AMP-forming)/AMP-acid ligase II
MDRVAASLDRDGVAAGEVISICAGTSLDYAVLFLGSLRAGVAVAPLAPSSTPESLVNMARDAGARLFFVDRAVAEAIAPAVASDAAMRASLRTLEGEGPQSYQAWLSAPGAAAPERNIRPEGPFNLIYSSGTTGAPKGIIQSNGMRWSNMQRGRVHGYSPEAVTLLSTPLYSNTTLVSFFATFALGGTVVLMAKFDATKYLTLAEKVRATHTMLVPVQYQRIMSHPEFDKHDLSSFKVKFCTSSPCAASLKEDVVRRWPGGLIELYGMTEGGVGFTLAAHLHPNKLHTVGLPVAGCDVRLIDDQGREVAKGEAGEVVGHSAAMMTGYHNQPEKTAEAEWHDATGKRFIRTGDIGRLDEDGFLILFDRKKDMIISGGFNIYPSDLENVLRTNDLIADASVVGVNSTRWGESPVAFVVLSTPGAASADDIKAWANERLGKTQRLAAVEIVDALPRSAIGKVLKRELRDQFKGAVE